MWNSNSLDKLARQFQESNEINEHRQQSSSIKDELNTPSRYGQKEAWSQGGMKQIYQIYDHSTGRHLAMAELKPNLDRDYTEVFLREARLTAALDHPNIISIHEIGLHEDESPYFTMDFLSNRTLTQLVFEHREKNSRKNSQQLLFERLDIFLKVCDAIGYAHSKGILHLDIKLSNVHIGLYGEVWVCDWGLGKSLDEPDLNFPERQHDSKELKEIWTQQNGIKGTPGSISPEQIRGYKNANKRSDIYSLGCLLYELVLLEKPFQGDAEQMLKDAQEGNWNFNKTKYLSHLPNSLKAVIKKSMALDENERYQNITQLKAEIELYMGGFSTHAEEADILVEAKLFIKRYKGASIVAASLSTFIILLTLLFIIKLQERTEEAQTAAKLARDQTKKVEAINAELNNERMMAERLKTRAEYVANQFKQEQKLLEEHKKALIHHDSSYYNVLLSDLIFREPNKSVQLAYKRLQSIEPHSKNYEWALDKLVYTAFTKQDFQNVISYYEKIKDTKTIAMHKDLYTVSKIYSDKLQLNQLLPIEDFASLLRDLFQVRTMKRTHLIEKVLSYDNRNREEKDYTDVIRAILKHWHETWDETGFNVNQQTQTVHISHPDLKMFTYVSVSSDLCILRFLDFDHLVLSGSGVYDLNHFDDLSLNSLDLRRTKVNSILALNDFKNVDKVIIEKDQFSEVEIESLNKHIKVVYK